jgi:transposase-like protein
MKKRKISAETKLSLLRRHLLDHEPAYRLAQEAGVDASTFHRWQRRFLLYSLRHGEDAFRRRHYVGISDATIDLNALLRKLSNTL